MKTVIINMKPKSCFVIIVSSILFIGLSMINTTISAQVSINATGAAPDGSAMLDIVSTTKGVLFPRVALTGTSSASPVSSPATGLMVFNTATTGDVTPGYYWWDGGDWVRFGSGSGGGCSTLDMAYDCGGAGVGRTITVDNGAIEFNNGANTARFINATNVANFTNGSDIVSLIGTGTKVVQITTSTKDEALRVTNSKAVSYGIYGENTNTGAAIYGENTSTSNLYSAIQGVSNYGSTSAGNYPSGVAGYFDGSGMGVGVWGESNGSGSSAGAGVYGSTSNNNFGLRGHGDNYPGIYASTDDASKQAIQMAGAGASALNPAMYALGTVQFQSSTNANGHSVIFNQVTGSQITMAPNMSGWGYLGGPSYYWWGIYSSNVLQVSRRETKRDITYLDNENYELVMNDIDNIKPAFYKYILETDKPEKDNEGHYRANMHLGVILDETPDYIQDNAFSAIDVYAISTLSLAGVKYNRAEIQELKENISDFGIIEMESNEIWVDFNNKFVSKLKSDNIPTVILTTNSPNAKVYISEQNNLGFRIKIEENTDNLIVNWIAMAKVVPEITKTNFVNEISPELYMQLVVPENIKKEAQEMLINSENQKTLQLLGDEDPNIKPVSKRVKIDE